MNLEMIRGLVYNASLLLAISIIYNSLFLNHEKDNKLKNVAIGVIIGIIGVLLIQMPVQITPGIIFDTRSILVSVAAMFFGLIPVVVADIIIITWRIVIGGPGVLMGVVVVILTSGIGLIWNKKRLEKILSKRKRPFVEFYIIGLVAHIGMIISEIVLPRDMILSVLRQTAVPIFIIYPIVSLLLSMVLFNEFKNNQIRLEIKESETSYKYLYHEHQDKLTLLKVLVNSIPDLIFYKDQNSVYVGCNSAFEKFAGREERDIIGHTDLDLFDKEMADRFRAMDKELLRQGKPIITEEVVTYPDRTEIYLETIKTLYSNSQGNVLGLIGISRDITERKKRENEILYLTYHDILTGLYNRSFFEEERKRLDTKRQLPLSVIMGDVNGLKLINDAFGHEEGDKLLIEIAKILKMCIRTEDIVARIGGDEFCILLPQTDAQMAQLIVDRIKRKCEDYIDAASRETCFASISLGYATKLKNEEPFEKVFRIAEEHMYRCKLLEYKSIRSSIISSIKMTMFEKSHETEAHTERLTKLSQKLGKALGLDDKEITDLELLSTLHDIGKISIDGNILAKSDKLTESEWLEIKNHPEVGYRITMASPELKNISEYILSHHERWDGKGYPQGLSGEDIPLLSRILAVVDSYDAMTQNSEYKKAITSEAAIEEIRNNAGTQFDPDIARLFIENILNAEKN